MNRQPKLSRMVLGHCVDCGKPCHVHHEYIVRGAVWMEAGMGSWESGHLHQHCLEDRLGRSLTADDLLVRFVRYTPDGSAEIQAHPDYITSPEYLLHS
jgi:hypothetical protein